MAQVCYGEMFMCKDRNARKEINSLRCDLAVVDSSGNPELIVEVIGSGHYGWGSEAVKEYVATNDKIKRHICNSAHVDFVALADDSDVSTMKPVIEALLARLKKEAA